VTPLEAAAAHYRAARLARDQARDELRAEVRIALAAGMSEVEAHQIAGVTRMTIRAWRQDQSPAPRPPKAAGAPSAKPGGVR